jgi:formylglycine-generating enzyme required for sulfatase activity
MPTLIPNPSTGLPRRLTLIVLLSSLLGCQEPPPGESPVDQNHVRLTDFTQTIPGTEVEFTMIAIPGGEFLMGSPASAAGRKDDEGPQHKVAIRPFWMAKCEVIWDEYDQWSTTEGDVDGVTRPTPPYVDMDFGMGRDGGYPAICMTQLAAKTYCEWLSKITGRRYRLPTEAEWEYACRAGTTTTFSFGDDRSKLDEYAWHEDNSDETYHKVAEKKPNPWGLYDMHGNVAEWTQDAYAPYDSKPAANPMVEPKSLYPRVVRGGGWALPPDQCRSANRIASHEDWKEQDPQIPKSIWYHTDADSVGFRVVCEPDPENKK